MCSLCLAGSYRNQRLGKEEDCIRRRECIKRKQKAGPGTGLNLVPAVRMEFTLFVLSVA